MPVTGSLFSLLLFTSLVGTAAQIQKLSEKNALALRKGEFWVGMREESEEKYTAFFRMADANCDGVLTSTEVSEGVASALGNDPFKRYKYRRYPWDEWYCEGKSFPIDPYYITIMISGFLVAYGRLDWRPCAMSLALSQMKSAGLNFATPENLTLRETLWWSRRFDELMQGTEQAMFRGYWDIDGDGCLSRAEWDRGMLWFSSHWNGKAKVTSFSEMWDLAPDEDIASILEQLNATCIDERRFSFWSKNTYYKSIPLVNNTAACYNKPEQHLGSDLSVVDLVPILGGCILASICICLFICLCICCYHRRLKSNLDESLQVQNLLKAKIDAWSTFDTELRSKVSELQPSFVHCLGLHDFNQDMLNLLEIVHPEDADSLRTALEQLNRREDASAMPILTSARFLFGVAFSTQCPPKLFEMKYRKVEVLMTQNRNSSILVGLTTLDAAVDPEPGSQQPGPELPSDFLYMAKVTSESHAYHDDGGSDRASQQSKGEVILNGSDAGASAPSEAITFKSMEATSHRGGQITAPFSHFKTASVASRLDCALSHVPHDVSISPESTSTPPGAQTIGASNDSDRM